ncbi:helicase associated ha2 domain-containing protein [Cyclospora cayetanensis]|uniref:Helicase associated ha2 domain-containing protein n=1 Tax=Cyclospora cayetanensis TaxID=88456 RepID=A0A1D3D7U8_9EIME|nr:helicase associated ha2 domain-containing protein [Cyclospora cayetanensis]
MSLSDVTAWLREELQRCVGAATRSLVAAVQAAADRASNSHQLSLTLQQELHFTQKDADFLAPELFQRMAAAEEAAAASAADEKEQAAQSSRKRLRDEAPPGEPLAIFFFSHFCIHRREGEGEMGEIHIGLPFPIFIACWLTKASLRVTSERLSPSRKFPNL